MWAKALFEGLFGEKEKASTNIIEDIIDELDEAKKANEETKYAQVLFDRLFHKEPAHLVQSLGDRIEKGQTEITKEEKEETQKFLDKIKVLKFVEFKMVNQKFKVACLSENSTLSLEKLSLEDTVDLFVETVSKIHKTRQNQIGSLQFDKDDPLAMDFVAAATNMRAINFGIHPETMFKIKEMAGKIVPAISSSNALVAALQVTEAIKLLKLSLVKSEKDTKKVSNGVVYDD